jgi:hypothetical protein
MKNRRFEVSLDELRAMQGVGGSPSRAAMQAWQGASAACGCGRHVGGRRNGRPVRKSYGLIEIPSPPTRRVRGGLSNGSRGPSFAFVDDHPYSDTFVAASPLPPEFDWSNAADGMGASGSNDPYFPQNDPFVWNGASGAEAFEENFVAWTEATLVEGGVGYACPSPYCYTTDPMDPIELGIDSTQDFIVAPAEFQWVWVGTFAGGLPPGEDYRVEVSGSAEGMFTRTVIANAVSGVCIRARQRIPNDPLHVRITRSDLGIGGQMNVVNLLLGGRIGYVP